MFFFFGREGGHSYFIYINIIRWSAKLSVMRINHLTQVWQHGRVGMRFAWETYERRVICEQVS